MAKWYTHTRIGIIIIMKPWPSAVIGGFQHFEKEKSDKIEMLFCLYLR